jgi:hypothetical protein
MASAPRQGIFNWVPGKAKHMESYTAFFSDERIVRATCSVLAGLRLGWRVSVEPCDSSASYEILRDPLWMARTFEDMDLEVFRYAMRNWTEESDELWYATANGMRRWE